MLQETSDIIIAAAAAEENILFRQFMIPLLTAKVGGARQFFYFGERFDCELFDDRITLTEYTNIVYSSVAVSTVNIAFEKGLLKAIDGVAKREHRSRSELVREAVRAYIEHKDRWKKLFDAYDRQQDEVLSDEVVAAEIRNYRRTKARA
ncbi:MAG: hypothetical protein OHK0011_24730 [Turneriella sp.]